MPPTERQEYLRQNFWAISKLHFKCRFGMGLPLGPELHVLYSGLEIEPPLGSELHAYWTWNGATLGIRTKCILDSEWGHP